MARHGLRRFDALAVLAFRAPQRACRSGGPLRLDRSAVRRGQFRALASRPHLFDQIGQSWPLGLQIDLPNGARNKPLSRAVQHEGVLAPPSAARLDGADGSFSPRNAAISRYSVARLTPNSHATSSTSAIDKRLSPCRSKRPLIASSRLQPSSQARCFSSSSKTRWSSSIPTADFARTLGGEILTIDG